MRAHSSLELMHLHVPLYDEEVNATNKRICVTGGRGYIAAHIIQRLLAAGHAVHATVRGATDGPNVEFLQQLPGAEERLKLFPADLMTPGSFDAALQDCEVGAVNCCLCIGSLHTDASDSIKIQPLLLQYCIPVQIKTRSGASIVERIMLLPRVSDVSRTTAVCSSMRVCLTSYRGYFFKKQ